MPFVKGKSGNPNGRPKGSRHKLAEDVLAKLATDFARHGETVIQGVREKDPATYLRVIASVLPKEIDATVRNISAQELGDDELADIATGSGDGATEAPVDTSKLN
jgi:hypothetical protein